MVWITDSGQLLIQVGVGIVQNEPQKKKKMQIMKYSANYEILFKIVNYKLQQ